MAKAHSNSLKTGLPADGDDIPASGPILHRSLRSKLVRRRLVRRTVEGTVFRLLIVARQDDAIGRLLAAEELGPTRTGRRRRRGLRNHGWTAANGCRSIGCRRNEVCADAATPRREHRGIISLADRNRLGTCLPHRFRAGMAAAEGDRSRKERDRKHAAHSCGHAVPVCNLVCREPV